MKRTRIAWRRGFVVAGCWRMGLRIFGDGGGRRPGYGSAHKQMAQLHPLHGQLSRVHDTKSTDTMQMWNNNGNPGRAVYP